MSFLEGSEFSQVLFLVFWAPGVAVFGVSSGVLLCRVEKGNITKPSNFRWTP